MKKKILILLGILGIGAIIGYNYIYKDHRNISNETAKYSVAASNLVQDFSKDASVAQQKYLNQTIEVTGTITAKDTNSVTLDDAVFCSLSNPVKVALNRTITIKGRFIGFDDLLEEVTLDQCTISN